MVVELGGEFSALAFFAEGEFGGEGAEFFLVFMDLYFGEFLFGDITDGPEEADGFSMFISCDFSLGLDIADGFIG